MKRNLSTEVGVFVLLAALGVALRLQFQSIPNFAPVASLALFAGYYFRSRMLAVLLPLSVMGMTDLVIGGYHPAMMAVVYACLAAPVFFRGVLRKWFSMGSEGQSSTWRAAAATGGLLGCSLGASVWFFLATNFAHWVFYDMYAKTAAGLLQCYAAALPFFRYTLAGDLGFACLLFGGYALADEYPISMFKGFIEMLNVGEGSTNVQKVLIAEDALGFKDANRASMPARKFRSAPGSRAAE